MKKQEPGVLSSLASVIGEPGQKVLVDQGASVLTSLLGGKTLSALTDSVGQYAGVSGSGSKNLLGLLGPVVLGVLGKEARDRGLDASGLANLLTSQKNNVSAAMPAGISKYLSQTDILDDVATSRTKTRVSNSHELGSFNMALAYRRSRPSCARLFGLALPGGASSQASC